MSSSIQSSVFLVAFWIVVSSRVYAAGNYTLDHVTAADGLPQSSVRAIAQDNLGFLWVGVETGLYRYDGYRFVSFQPPGGGVPVTQVSALSDGRLWIAWFDKPATVYDPATNVWEQLPIRISGYFDQGFIDGPDGSVWLADGNRLVTIDPESLDITVVASSVSDGEALSRHMQFVVWFEGAIWTNFVDKLAAVDDETYDQVYHAPVKASHGVKLWVHDQSLWYCNGGGVYRTAQSRTIIEVYSDPDANVSSCAHDAAGDLWVGTSNRGAFRIARNKQMVPFSIGEADEQILGNQYVVDFQLDSLDQLWILTRGTANLYADDKITSFVYNESSIVGHLGGMAARSMFEDRSGVLWLGTEGSGLARISPYAVKFRHIAPPSDIDSHVRKPAVDLSGNIWMGTNQDGVFRWNRESDTWKHFPANADDEKMLPTGDVRALLATRNGDIWAGSSYPGTLSRFNDADSTWTRFENESRGISSLLETVDGTILVARTFDVAEFDPITEEWRQFRTADAINARTLAGAKSGIAYVGTHGGVGLIEFLPHQGFGRTWSTEISERNIFALLEDDAENIWIGTWSGGLNRLNPATRESQVITKEHGLPDDTVFGILRGVDDELWVSTYEGIARITGCISLEFPCLPEVTLFDAADGLQQTEFDSESYLRTPSGELYFGGQLGLTYFHPAEIYDNPVAPVVQLSEIILNGEPQRIESREQLSPLSLGNEYGVLELRFSALDFHKPDNNRYQFRVHRDDEWTPLENGPTLSLPNVRHGRHTVEIRGSNNDGVWSESPLVFQYRVAPPAYLTYPAFVAYLLLAALIALAVIRYRERQFRASQVKLEAVVSLRTQELTDATRARDEFYANVSHEVRTPLTLLIHSAERMSGDRSDQNIDSCLRDINRHAQHLQQYVDSLITVAHLNSTTELAWFAEDLGQFIVALISDMQTIAGETTIQRHNFPEDPIFVRSQPNALNVIFSNLISNALRHTPAGQKIDVIMDELAETVVVLISDSGSGINPAMVDDVFERGHRGSADSVQGDGFGIGLSLVKQTVRALGGHVSARNNPEGGAQFEVRLVKADSNLPITTFDDTRGLPLELSNTASTKETRRASSDTKWKPTVLLVEDNLEMCQSVESYLAPSYRMLLAHTAEMGISLASENVPDLVLCDVMLPDGNGFEVLSEIKSSVATDHVPVLMLSARADEKSKRRGLQDRADAYVTKPFSLVDLKLLIRNVLEDRRKVTRHAAITAWQENTSQTATDESNGPTFEKRIMEVLQLTYGNSDANVDSIAQSLAMSRRQLERKTRFSFDMSPNAMLSEYRLNKAAELLRYDHKVVDVSTQCGFGSQGHFGTLFKARYGTTPGDYARAHRN